RGARTREFARLSVLLCFQTHLRFFIGGEARLDDRVFSLAESWEEKQKGDQEEMPERARNHFQHFRLIRRMPSESTINFGQWGGSASECTLVSAVFSGGDSAFSAASPAVFGGGELGALSSAGLPSGSGFGCVSDVAGGVDVAVAFFAEPLESD